jgi:hypothetical protein
MEIGDYFSADGYQRMATIQGDLGDVVVLGNNSTHLLVALQPDEAMSDGEPSVQLLASYPYTDDWIAVYGAALTYATAYVMHQFTR